MLYESKLKTLDYNSLQNLVRVILLVMTILN